MRGKSPAANGAYREWGAVVRAEYAAERRAERFSLRVWHKRLDRSGKAAAMDAPGSAASAKALLCERKCKRNAALRCGGKWIDILQQCHGGRAGFQHQRPVNGHVAFFQSLCHVQHALIFRIEVHCAQERTVRYAAAQRRERSPERCG